MGSLSDSHKLFTPLKIGNMQLSHRIIMSPLTRKRCPAGIPSPLVAGYYSQRATKGGLIISEGCHPSVMVSISLPGHWAAAKDSKGKQEIRCWYQDFWWLSLKKAGNLHGIPGMYTPEHIRAWKVITDAVHAKGAYMACQLWHVSQNSPPKYLFIFWERTISADALQYQSSSEIASH